MARNHGEDSAEGELIVKSVTTIVAGPTDTTQTLGSTIRMECEVGCGLEQKYLDLSKKIFQCNIRQQEHEKYFLHENIYTSSKII